MTFEELLASLTSYEEGVKGPLPDPYRFLGQQVGFVIQTEPIPRTAARPPNEQELGLARLVFEGLPEIIRKAEEGFQRHHRDYPEFITAASCPHIWINEEALELDGHERWAFVVENAQNEFYGTHLVFDGLELLEVWSGD